MNPLNNIQQLIKISLVIVSLLMAPLTTFAAELVNINRADAATMIENWKGIGEKKARAIVSYRKKNGKFSSIDDLANVKGMGEGLIKNNRKYMSLSKGLIKPSGKATTKSTSKAKTDKTKKSSSSKTKKTTKPTKKSSGKSTSKSKIKECTAKSKDKNCIKKPTKKKSTKKTTKKKPKAQS